MATFRTTTPSESITLPLLSGYTNNFTVDWGDGSPTSDVTTYNDADRIHTYTTAGDHQVSITGSMPMWGNVGLANNEEIKKLVSMDDAGEVNFGTGVTDMSYMFGNAEILESVALFDTSSVTNMSEMFAEAAALTSVPLFDTSSVEDMSYMFSLASSLTTVPLFSTVSVTNMDSMFTEASSLTSVPLFNTSTVTNMYNMFNGATSLSTIPSFDTSSVTTMGHMFYGATSLSTIPLLDSSSVNSTANFFNIFEGTTGLTQGALSGTQYTIDYSDTNIAYSALKDVLDNLGNASGGSQTITLTGNPGQPELTPVDCAGAEGKGWTVIPACTATPASCTTYATTFFNTFHFYGSSSALSSLGSYAYQYFYYDCESKSFQFGNQSNALASIPNTSSYQGTTTELNAIDTGKTAVEDLNYYDTDTGTFKVGATDGSLVTLTAPTGRILDGTAIAAVSGAAEGDFYFNTTTGAFHIGQSNGSLAVLFTTN